MSIVTAGLLAICAILAVWIHLHGGRMLKAPIALGLAMGELTLSALAGFIVESVVMMRGDSDTLRVFLFLQGILFFFALISLVAFVLLETGFKSRAKSPA